ncbi:hypothetical protein, partial [Pseudomonas sp. 770NI]|uniref:hypothetical protein n=1 Tax=Pseudomonas sp. 770NI TaxID=2528664 RepID=UPI001C497EC4
GAGRLNRHPCRFTPQIPVEFRPAWFTGRLRSKADQEQDQDQDQDQERLASHRGYLGGTFDFSVD